MFSENTPLIPQNKKPMFDIKKTLYKFGRMEFYYDLCRRNPLKRNFNKVLTKKQQNHEESKISFIIYISRNHLSEQKKGTNGIHNDS